MQVKSAEHHFAHAALRHYEDAVLLHDGVRLPNADHHFGFAVECALKSLLLRFTTVSMNPKPNGKPASKPWSMHPTTGKVQEHGHLPELATDISLLMHGRSASGLSAALTGLSAFATWSVNDRYRDGSDVGEADVRQRRTVAENILALHDHALLTGRLP
ncbi:hypothetical protein ABT117_12960 [Streptomyces sp. NPDC002262]|uniref:hypothetical protein n=1 Tax=Streptomyces sp. NPDC002262 TaxID=3154414 RepID=UPI003324E9E7